MRLRCMSTLKTAAEAPCTTASRPWSFSQEVAANVGRWEPETRINSLQTAVSARRLGVNRGEEGPTLNEPRTLNLEPRKALVTAAPSHPEATLRLTGSQPVGALKPLSLPTSQAR